jgi:thiamine-monophosphate kinase
MVNCADMGERELIRRISKILGGVVNDDCAVIDAGDLYFVATTDMLHRETDFPDIMTPWQIGWMTSAVNLSDVAAMGAEPSGVLVAAGIPPDTDISFIDELFRGLRDCAEEYGTKVLGGDLDSPGELNLTGCAFGFIEKGLILRRSGARVGDLLCTTGTLGGAGAGLWALKHGDIENGLIKNLIEPRPRIREGRALALSGAVTAMIDNSDGLALSLSDLSEVNGLGFVVEEDALPIARCIKETVGIDKALNLVLSAGGDFELVFTVRPEMLEAARKACEFTIIGETVDQGIWMRSQGSKRRIEPKGYEHRIGKCK